MLRRFDCTAKQGPGLVLEQRVVKCSVSFLELRGRDVDVLIECGLRIAMPKAGAHGRMIAFGGMQHARPAGEAQRVKGDVLVGCDVELLEHSGK